MMRIEIIPLTNSRFEVAKDFEFSKIKVPKGFISNGANIPRIFWSFYPPNKPDYLPAAILHDYLYERAGGDFEMIKNADLLFKYCLKDLGVSSFTANIFYYSLRAFNSIKKALS